MAGRFLSTFKLELVAITAAASGRTLRFVKTFDAVIELSFD